MQYDLEKRTKQLSLATLTSLKSVPITLYNRNIISQLLRSVTSIGANYCEANGAISKNDFINKIHLCKKEAKETLYWFELLSTVTPETNGNVIDLSKECYELLLIFSRIAKSAKNNKIIEN